MQPLDWSFPYTSQKMPLLAANAVSASQPLGAQAGLSMLYQGATPSIARLPALLR